MSLSHLQYNTNLSYQPYNMQCETQIFRQLPKSTAVITNVLEIQHSSKSWSLVGYIWCSSRWYSPLEGFQLL